MSTTVGAHSGGAGPLSLISCVRESSPLQDYETDVEKNVSKRKFWNPKKWFRKKQKTSDENVTHVHQEQRDVDGTRSRSTGELSTDEEPSRSHEVRNSSSMHPGLSVSHDSVFHPLNSGSSDLELDGAQSSSSLSISQPLGDIKLQTELNSRLQLRRGRGDTSEDDEGLPRSPLCGSPAAATDSFLILEKAVNKDLPTKSHSTCSDGSLLSMDSSEMEEDSIGLPSKNSSKVSLTEKRVDLSNYPLFESDIELGPSFLTAPLNHSAAHHRVSVRPKRTYGAPRRKKGQISTALPATPEVNEEASTRSISPESITTEPITELYSSTARTSAFTSHSYETKFKCNSLPAGVTPPTSESFRLNRSKSNAGKSQDDTTLHGEEREEKLSFLERLFPRISGKKKKKEEKIEKYESKRTVSTVVDSGSFKRHSDEKVSMRYPNPIELKLHNESKTTSTQMHIKREEMKPSVPRTGAASRQRVQPIDIPVSPRATRESVGIMPTSPTSPERLFHSGTSPIQAELENILKQRQMHHVDSGVKELSPPPLSPNTTKAWESNSSVIKREYKLFESKSSHFDVIKESKISSEDLPIRAKITGLSSLQQRVLSLNTAYNEDPPKLPTDIIKPKKIISKSHSFKNQKVSTEKLIVESSEEFIDIKKSSVTKSSSLDSVKNLEEPILKSELQMILKPVDNIAEKIHEVKLMPKDLPSPNVADVLEKDDNSNKIEKVELCNNDYPEHVKNIIEQDNLTDIENSVHTYEEKSEESAIISNTYSSNVFEEHSVKNNNQTPILPTTFGDSITISGPSHTAVVNVSRQSEKSNNNFVSDNEFTEADGIKSIVHKESQVSVTKIHLKQETTEITRTSVTVPKPAIPEFLNKQLNKVETRPASNIILSMKSQKSVNDENENIKSTTSVNISAERPQQLPRKFSKEDVEIIEKSSNESSSPKDDSPPKTPTLVIVAPLTPNQNRFKKNDSKPSSRKSSIISITPESPIKEHIQDRALKSRSISLDSLKTEQNGIESSVAPDKSSQDSLDKLDEKNNDGVILRRKSLVKQKKDEEPELMKVFARRSLKLKDSDIEQIQEAILEDKFRDSDKENIKDSPPQEVENIPKEAKERIEDDAPPKSKQIKTPVNETRKSSESIKNSANEESEVQLRRSITNNKFMSSQRAISLNAPKTIVSDVQIKKQSSLNERRKTDQWHNIKDESVHEKKTESEIILSISDKSEEVQSTTKNVSQRRAEWEKRVQQAKK